MKTFSDLTSVGGFRLGEVASALQKCIRRGLEADALFWATELDLSGYGEYAWKRLKIIASEDIGPADNQAAVVIRSLYQSWLDQRKKDDQRHGPERLFLVHAVMVLARAPKCRIVDHALINFYEARGRLVREIPDCALDKHTLRGRQKKRGHEHFWTEGAKLANAANLPDPYYDLARDTRSETQGEFDIDIAAG
jgi:replication-associated recombination protein RarA